ncbi:hypothetical protein [Endozoicomonas sp. ALD040]|uniref:hypothetical protein n=1 Tax=Endozoicomonas sp. ALD040 TaxID=3403079 RepID=UPI003BB0876D
MHSNILVRAALVILILTANSSFSASDFEISELTRGHQRTSDYLESIRNNRPLLQMFMNKLPKGGNLHHHLMGAIEPKEIIDIAIERGFCMYKNHHMAPCDCCTQSVKKYVDNEENHAALIRQLSLPDSHDPVEVRNKLFFNYFPTLKALFDGIDARFISYIRKKAAVDGLSYIESTVYFDEANGPDKLFSLITHLPTPNPDSTQSLEDFRAKLSSQSDFHTQLKTAAGKIANALKASDDHLNCSHSHSHPACSVSVRFLHQVHRTEPLPQVYAQMIFAFELAQLSLSGSNPQVLGINISGSENSDTALNDYPSHMKMLSFLKNHKQYPLVKERISLNAGEMARATVEDFYYRTAMADAIQIVKPKRVGHGISLMAQNCLKQSGSGNEEYANCSAELLKTMLDHDIAVEIPFTSNQRLSATGPRSGHPFPVYVNSNIAVTLATDYPGILKVDLTSQFVEAVHGFSPDQTGESFLLSFDQIVEFARNSLEFSFLPGQSLWLKSEGQSRYQKRVPACLDLGSEACKKFVSGNTKARFQRDHESRLKDFMLTAPLE